MSGILKSLMICLVGLISVATISLLWRRLNSTNDYTIGDWDYEQGQRSPGRTGNYVDCYQENHYFKMKIHDPSEDIFISRHIFETRTVHCDTALILLIKACIRMHNEKCFFVDIGSNIGSCAVIAALMGARVVAIEPSPRNLNLLIENIEMNFLQEKIDVFPVGVGARNTVLQFFLSKSNQGHNIVGERSALLESSHYRKSQVLLSTIDILFQQRVHVMKLDIEGREYDAIQGAKNLLQNFGVDVIYFEFIPYYISNMGKDRDLPNRLLLDLEEIFEYKICKKIDARRADYCADFFDRQELLRFSMSTTSPETWNLIATKQKQFFLK